MGTSHSQNEEEDLENGQSIFASATALLGERAPRMQQFFIGGSDQADRVQACVSRLQQIRR
jgi:hypothetical protein